MFHLSQQLLPYGETLCLLRFYFISDDELLSVLGSSGHEAVQPLMLKLFDNCKELLVDASGQVVLGTVLLNVVGSPPLSLIRLI